LGWRRCWVALRVPDAPNRAPTIRLWPRGGGWAGLWPTDLAVAFFVVIPMLIPLLRQIYEPALIIQHLVYGAVTGLLYSMLRPQPYISQL
jgi:hypothetical protein